MYFALVSKSFCSIKKNIFSGKWYFYLADPAHGYVVLNEQNFKKNWITDEHTGIALFLEPTDLFYQLSPPPKTNISLAYLFSYLENYKKQLSILFLLLLLGSGLTLIFPFLTQQLIDKGVQHKNLHMITLILLAQLSLFLGNITIEIIRNSLMLYVSTKINIAIISDF